MLAAIASEQEQDRARNEALIAGRGGLLNNSNNYMQQLAPEPDITIPMKGHNWKRLTRETQIRLLDELGILNKGVL